MRKIEIGDKVRHTKVNRAGVVEGLARSASGDEDVYYVYYGKDFGRVWNDASVLRLIKETKEDYMTYKEFEEIISKYLLDMKDLYKKGFRPIAKGE